jgi:hypothetical protein
VSKGRIHRIVCYLEKQHTSFAVSRLIMMSGIQVRKFTPETDDNAEALNKIRMALRAILKAEDLTRMQQLFEG